MTTAQVPNPRDFFGKTSCSKCNGAIGKGEYRVVLMAVEMKPEVYEPDYVPAGPAHSTTWSFCSLCLADMGNFEVPNVWRVIPEDIGISDGSRNEDASKRSVSLSARAAAAARALDDPYQGKEGSVQDAEDAISTTADKPTKPEPPSQEDLRLRVARILESPESWRVPSRVRAVAKLWCSGAKQGDIGEKLGMDQSTVSRLLKQAKALR